MAGQTDDEVMALALDENRVLVTTDTDFGTILALTGAAGPNVLLLRGVGDSVSERVAAILVPGRTSASFRGDVNRRRVGVDAQGPARYARQSWR